MTASPEMGTHIDLPGITVSSTPNCNQTQLANTTFQTISNLNLSQEYNTAIGSPFYRSAAQNYTVALQNQLYSWSNATNCTPQLVSPGLIFSAIYSNGTSHGEFQILETANLATVTNATWISSDTGSTMCGRGAKDCWSGYEFHNPGASWTRSQMGWDLPIANPSTNCGNGCTEKVVVWVGQTVQAGGGSGSNQGIAQIGTLSTVSVNWWGTSRSYNLWYEFFPGAFVVCPTLFYSPAAGNFITAEVKTVVYHGIWVYYLTLTDWSIGGGWVCTAISGMAMGTPPNYYQFMMENPEDLSTGTPWQGPNTGTVYLSWLNVNGLGANSFSNYKYTQMPNDQVSSLGYNSLLADYFSEADSGCAC